MIEVAETVYLSAILLVCCVKDIRYKKIPNICILAGIIGRLFFVPLEIVEGNTVDVWEALQAAVLFAAGTMPLYLLHMTGAGDVKLLCMTGFFIGMERHGIFFAGLLSAGGFIAMVKLVRYKCMKKRFLYLWNYVKGIYVTKEFQTYGMPENQEEVMGMAVPVFCGVLCWRLSGWL